MNKAQYPPPTPCQKAEDALKKQQINHAHEHATEEYEGENRHYREGVGEPMHHCMQNAQLSFHWEDMFFWQGWVDAILISENFINNIQHLHHTLQRQRPSHLVPLSSAHRGDTRPV